MNEPAKSSDADLVPDLLWHYTSANGLLGILDNWTIWASDLEFLNDATEDKILWDRVQRRVGAIVDRTTDVSFEEFLHRLSPEENKDERRQAAEQIVCQLEKIRPELIARQSQNNFVACFSSVADSLSQWRAYTSGSGYAIGFSGRVLESLQPNPTNALALAQSGQPRMVFNEVMYLEDKNTDDIDRLITILVAAIDGKKWEG